MAQIAEDLLLLLLDNAASRPALDRDRREKVLGAAVLLDLAWACRIRPSVAGEPIAPPDGCCCWRDPLWATRSSIRPCGCCGGAR